MPNEPAGVTQTQRLVFGLVFLLIAVVLLGNGLGNLMRSGPNGSLLLPIAVGCVFLAASVYLGIRFAQSRTGP